jgi:ribosomal RNA-processing protein 8
LRQCCSGESLAFQGTGSSSYDLVSDGAFVVEADSGGTIPLAGSEGNDEETTNGDALVVDVTVCSLNLMGKKYVLNAVHSTFWPNTIREAWRILKPKYALPRVTLPAR